jgi:hypothetical protein
MQRTKFVQGISYKWLIQILLSACIYLFFQIYAYYLFTAMAKYVLLTFIEQIIIKHYETTKRLDRQTTQRFKNAFFQYLYAFL